MGPAPKWLLIVIAVAIMSAAVGAQSDIKFKDLKFSQDEVRLLKRVKQIEDGANVASSMLKASPFVQLFTSTSAQDLLITIKTNDWDKIGDALKGLGKIKACQVVKEVELFKIDTIDDPSRHPNPAFFDALQARYDQGC